MITVDQLRSRLTSDSSFDSNLPTNPAFEALLEEACTNATAIICSYIGDGQPFSFGTLGTAIAPISRTYTGDGSICQPLDLPLQQFVSADNGGMAVAPAGVWLEPVNSTFKNTIILKPEEDDTQYGWDTDRQSVVISGVWGWGDAPAEVIEAALEIAVRIVKGRSAGYSDTVGINPDGTQQYIKALPPLVKLALDLFKKHVQSLIGPPSSGDFGWFGVA